MTPRNPYEFNRAEYNELVKKIPHPVESARSEYEEIELVEDCTLYDIYRQPRQPVTDPNATRSLHVRVLNADLTCPICLGIIRNTKVVMECLHRFCSVCIDESLRKCKNECPSCRMHIPSKRSLRLDTNFDELITKIYPNLDEFRDQEERLVAEINRERHCNNSVMESTKLGVEKQQVIRRNGGKKKLDPEASPSSSAASSPNGEANHKRHASWNAASSTSNGSASLKSEENGHKKQRTANGTTSNGHASSSSAAASSSQSTAEDKEKEKVNVRVLLHPEESSSAPKLTHSLFRTTPALTIGQLKKHLKTLLKLDSLGSMRMVLPALNHKRSGLRAVEKEALKTDENFLVRKDLKYDQELEDFFSLRDIYQQYSMGTDWELQLQYHFSDTIVNGVARFIANGV